LELLFALPSSDSDSDVEADDGASEELLHLDTENNSGLASPDPGLPQTTSGEQLRRNRQFDMQFDDKAPYVRSPVDDRAKEHDYFRLLFSNHIVENLVEQTNLYATQPRTKTVL